MDSTNSNEKKTSQQQFLAIYLFRLIQYMDRELVLTFLSIFPNHSLRNYGASILLHVNMVFYF